MTSSTTPFPIKIVSTDRTALRELSWALSSFGYQVDSSSDWNENAAWQQVDTPSLLILDARDEDQTRVALASQRATPFVYRIALYDANSSAKSNRLLESGADDLVRFPVNIGELLSRIKSGARRLEFERRLGTTIGFDKHSRITNQRRFIRQLERQLRDTLDTKDGVLIVLGIDSLDSLRSQNGNFAVAEATTILAQCLGEELTDEDCCGVVDEGVFAVLLQGSSVSEGLEWAEDISSKFTGQAPATEGGRARHTISGVVLNWPTGNTASHEVQRGVTILGQVRSFGGDLILDGNEVEQIHSDWKQKFPPYHEVFAHHVMEALPLVLPINGENSIDRESLGIYAFASGQNLPPCIPVVDEKGLFLGVIESNSFRQCGNDVFDSIEEHLIPVSETIKGDVRLDAIISTMASNQKDYLVVVEDSKPIGFITYENIVAMAVDPIGGEEDSQPVLVDAGMNSLVIPLS
ncbi:diguanylate cyclase domain-containing protein [Bythopirellula polymerisocia]|uniref:Response regulator PleD n=1 Tax=Bythopirellula polymerisocia TaxID=2528003 RepID=A0A5C6CEG8_9BACT|nr:diguanylate cyclase [Bythopirellula polymerisocia]TWU21904.1 response regulator PleD [Bythopirellula polymerisocia]